MKKLFFLCVILIAVSGSAFAQLPALWYSNDVGTVGGTGTAAEAAGTYTLSDRGSQIYSIADSGRFAYRHAEPDASAYTLSARVVTMSATDPSAQACVMIRETLLPGAKMFAVCANKLNGISVIARLRQDEAATVTSMGSRAFPIYLRITRADLDFLAEYSTDGSTWVAVGSTSRISMTRWCLFGLMTSAHETGTLRAATFTNVAYTFPSVASYFYASPTATSGTGTWADPYSIDQVLKTVSITAGSRILLRGGIYKIGSIVTTLAGSSASARTTLRSLPGERAVFDGERFTRTTGGTGTQACLLSTTVTVESTAGMTVGETTVSINGEQMLVADIVGLTVTLIRCRDATTRYRPSSGIHPTGSLVRWTQGTILTSGPWVDWWDIEITNSNPSRAVVPYDSESDNRTSQARGPGMVVSGANQRIINAIVHDTADGIVTTEAATSFFAYGLLLHNVGVLGFNRGNGHGLYLQNAGTVPVNVKYSISGNAAATTMKAYGETGGANRVYFDRLIAFGSASMYRRGTNTSYGIATIELQTAVNPITYGEVTNSVMYTPDNISGSNLQIGYQAPYNENVTLTNNYVIGGQPAVNLNNWRSVTIQDNFFYNTNGNPAATQGIITIQNSTYAWSAAGLFMTGSVGVRNSGDRVPTCIGKGWVDCPNQVRIGDGSIFTVASVSEDGNTVTFSGTPPPAGNVTIQLLSGATIKSHPNPATFNISRNTYYNDIQGTGGSSGRATYAFQYTEPGITPINGLGGGSLRWTPDPPSRAFNDWCHCEPGSFPTASSYNIGKPTGVTRGVNLLTDFDSGDGRVAHAWFVNWQDASSVTIQGSALTTVLSTGDQYEIRKAENYFGAPVASGTFDGNDITIPTTDRTVTARIGDDFISPSTFPRFGALVVIRK